MERATNQCSATGIRSALPLAAVLALPARRPRWCYLTALEWLTEYDVGLPEEHGWTARPAQAAAWPG